MDRYVIIGQSAAIHCGVLELTDEQAEPRLHNLHDLGDGLYSVVRPVEFKAGERIGYDSAIPKALAEVVVPEAVAESKPARRRK